LTKSRKDGGGAILKDKTAGNTETGKRMDLLLNIAKK